MAVPAGAPTSKRQASAPGAEDEIGGDAKRPSSAVWSDAVIAGFLKHEECGRTRWSRG
jgi:hypothetical protein